MNALKQAGTRVFEPVNQFEVELPIDSTSAVLTNLVECGATSATTTARGATSLIQGTIPARNVPAFEQKLPGLSQGEGILLTRFHSFRPVTGPTPTRRRTGNNPLDGREYLLHALGRI
jgi:ribosomal protection tetracycline resistance protein